MLAATVMLAVPWSLGLLEMSGAIDAWLSTKVLWITVTAPPPPLEPPPPEE